MNNSVNNSINSINVLLENTTTFQLAYGILETQLLNFTHDTDTLSHSIPYYMKSMIYLHYVYLYVVAYVCVCVSVCS